MPLYTDQLNRTLSIIENPKRIISLVPSQTEFLSHLGLDAEVIGITKFCIHPENWFRNKTRVGGTKNLNPETIASLCPDLIIANKEENTKEQIEALEKTTPVWISDVDTINAAYDMMHHIGIITSREKEAGKIIDAIQCSFELLKTNIPHRKIRTAYLIWKDPYMAAGSGTFINDMLSLNGCENVFADSERYPVTDYRDLLERKTELLLLSSEPYPFQHADVHIFQKKLPQTFVMQADGEMFSWYGSRMLQAGQYFQQFQAYLKQNNV